MVVQTFKKKPVAIEAVRWPGDIATADFIEKWSQGKCVCYANGGLSIVIAVRTLEGEMNAKPGDWIIKGIKGEFYPCNPEVFDLTYEEVLPSNRLTGSQVDHFPV